MSLDALVQQIGRALGEARGLLGAGPVPGVWGATGSLSAGRDAVAQATGAAALSWQGAGGSAYVGDSNGRVAALDSVLGADTETGTAFGASADASRRGGAAMQNVIDDTRAGLAAVAPSTDTPAGRAQLVAHLQNQVQRAKVLLVLSQRRNVELAEMIRAAAAGYRGPVGAPTIGAGATGPAMNGDGGVGATALPHLAGLTRAPPTLQNTAAGAGVAPATAAARIAVDAVNYGGRGQFPDGPKAMAAAIDDALDARGVTDPAARRHWKNGYRVLIDRETAHNAHPVNLSDSNAAGAPQPDGAPAGCSRGPAQLVPGTFAAFHQPGTSNAIYDPVSNIAASMNYVIEDKGVQPDGANLAAVIAQADPHRAGIGY